MGLSLREKIMGFVKALNPCAPLLRKRNQALDLSCPEVDHVLARTAELTARYTEVFGEEPPGSDVVRKLTRTTGHERSFQRHLTT